MLSSYHLILLLITTCSSLPEHMSTVAQSYSYYLWSSGSRVLPFQVLMALFTTPRWGHDGIMPRLGKADILSFGRLPIPVYFVTRIMKCSVYSMLRSISYDEEYNEQPLLYSAPSRPSIIVPIGVTLKIALDQSHAVYDASTIKSMRFSCPSSLDLVHRLRRCSDAVLVGRMTVQTDDCSLTVRRVGLKETGRDQPVRVVLDTNLCLLKDAISGSKAYTLLNDGLHTLVYHRSNLYREKNTLSSSFNNRNLKLVRVHHDTKSKLLSPMKVLNDLQDRGIRHIMVEGGPRTAMSFLRDRVVDRAIFIHTPITFREAVPSRITIDVLNDAGLEMLGARICGDDFTEYWVRHGESWPTEKLVDWP